MTFHGENFSSPQIVATVAALYAKRLQFVPRALRINIRSLSIYTMALVFALLLSGVTICSRRHIFAKLLNENNSQVMLSFPQSIYCRTSISVIECIRNLSVPHYPLLS